MNPNGCIHPNSPLTSSWKTPPLPSAASQLLPRKFPLISPRSKSVPSPQTPLPTTVRALEPYEEFSMMDLMISKMNWAICTGKPLDRCQSTDPKFTSKCALFVQETKAWWEAFPKNVEELLDKAWYTGQQIYQCAPRDIKEIKEVLIPQVELQQRIAKTRMDLEKLKTG